MNSDSAEAIFARYVAKDGGRFDSVRGTSAELVPLFENFRVRATCWVNDATAAFRPEKKLPWIHFDFVDNTSLDALAFRSEGRYFIGVHMGTPLLIADLFCRMLSCSDILPRIGDASAETRRPQQVPKLYTDSDYIEQVRMGSSFKHVFTVPQDPVRHQYAMLLAQMTMDFLIAHELAHVLDAHLLLSEQLIGIPLICEAKWYASEGATPMFEQALEMDADSFAVAEGFEQCLYYCDNPNKVPLGWRIFFAEPAESLYAWVFAIYSFFRIFGAGDYEVDKLPFLGHPPPRMRQQLIVDTLRGNIAQKRPGLLKTYDHVGARKGTKARKGLPWRVSVEVEKAVAYLTTGKIDMTGYSEALSLQGKAHVGAILNELDDIRPTLIQLVETMRSSA